MTTVNWERMSGDDVEALAATLILKANPRGNRITPSRGDKGIDIRIPNDLGSVDIYQVKKFAAPLDSNQQKQVAHSYETFANRILPNETVNSWVLVCPWNPTNDRLTWLKLLGKDTPDLSIDWMGLTQLDFLAAEHPRVVDYFCGNGKERTQDLMALVLAGGAPVEPAVGQPLLDAAVSRYRQIVEALQEVDPFYRYELEIRPGIVPFEPPWETEEAHLAAACISLDQIDSAFFRILRVFPLLKDSHFFRPISSTIEFHAEPGSAESDALERFFRYGAPFEGVAGTVIESEGPPGAEMPLGEGLFSFHPLLAGEPQREIELRLTNDDGSLRRRLELPNVEVTFGSDQRGIRIFAKDRLKFFHVEILIHITEGGGGGGRVIIEAPDLPGRAPRDVHDQLHFLADIQPHRRLEAALRDGQTFTPPWPVRAPRQLATETAHACDILIELQQHTLERVTFSTTTPAWLEQVFIAGRLLAGEKIQNPWSTVHVTRPDPEQVTLIEQPDQAAEPDEVQVVQDCYLTVEGHAGTIQTDIKLRVHLHSAHMVSEAIGGGPAMLKFFPLKNEMASVVRIFEGDWIADRIMVAPAHVALDIDRITPDQQSS